MKALRLHGVGDLRLHEEQAAIPSSGESELRVQAVGICGSDLHWLQEGGIGEERLARPLILGHEFAAVTEEGEGVAVDPAISCGACEMCRTGNPNLCADLVMAGHGEQDGAMRTMMPWPTKCLHSLPARMTFADGAMLEPLGIALHSVDLAKLRPAMTVGVFGCGTIGLLIQQLASLSGASMVVATDRLAHRANAAKSLGASEALLADGGREIGELLKLTAGRGFDVVFEAAGEQDAAEAAFTSVRAGGKVILVGIPTDDRTSFQASVARRKGLTVKMVRRMKHTYPRAIQLVDAGRIDVRSLVTHRFPLSRAQEAFEVAKRREGIKVILEPAQEGK